MRDDVGRGDERVMTRVVVESARDDERVITRVVVKRVTEERGTAWSVREGELR